MSGYWLFAVDALDPDDRPVTLRFSTPGYIDPEPIRWIPRIKQPGLFRAGLFAGDLLSTSRSGYGETTLINNDGQLDWLVDYATDGRRVVLERVDEDKRVTVLDGTVARVGFESGRVSFKLRDPLERLQQPHPHNRFAGDNVAPNGLEGTDEDIGGNVKPRLYGQVRNANISQFAVNTQKLIYQVSDADCTVTAVYDRGAELTFDGDYSSLADLQRTAPASSGWQNWEPPKGTWRRYKGYVRLGSSPLGEVTCDAHAPVTRAGEVVKQLAREAGATVDSIGALNDRGDVRLWVTDETPTAALIDRLVASCAGFWRVTQVGRLVAGLLTAPGAPVLTLRDHHIISIDREAAGAGSNGLPVGRVTWQADRIETVQSDLAGGVSETRRARLSSQYRDAVAESKSTLDRHPLAAAVTVASDLATRSAGQQTARDVLALLSPRRDRLKVVARISRAAAIQIGQTIRIETPRLGYSAGRNVLVVGREPDGERNRVTLNLWG
ncbi:hypothetical protein [Vreelandella sp. EE7]